MTQAKDRQRKRENKRAKRSLVHKASVKQRNTSKVGIKKKISSVLALSQGRTPYPRNGVNPLHSYSRVKTALVKD